MYTQQTETGFRFSEFTLLGSHFSVRVQVPFDVAGFSTFRTKAGTTYVQSGRRFNSPVRSVRLQPDRDGTWLTILVIVGVMLLMAIIGGVVLSRRLSQPQLELIVEEEHERRHEEE